MNKMSSQKILVFDSSTLISFAMNGLLEEIADLKSIFKGKFIVTEEVKEEIIYKPMNIRRFKLEALQLKDLCDRKILEDPESIGISKKEVSKKTQEYLDIANGIFDGDFYKEKRKVHLIDSGEASCLALAQIIKEKTPENEVVIATDERTTRMLCEKPENLKELLEKKLHIKIKFNKEEYKYFKGFNFLRSTELVYIAYKKGLLNIKNSELLDAALYAMRSKGAAVSDEEIKEIKLLDKKL